MNIDLVTLLCRSSGLPEPVTEFRFDPTRRWRFDWAWVDKLVALEQEGGVWVQGRHSRGVGFERDCVKYAEATLAGWAVFRASPNQIRSGAVLDWLERALR